MTAIRTVAIISSMENTHILILSANTGEGHNSAAKALAEALEARGCTCRIADGLSFLPFGTGKTICRSHSFFYRRLPKLYGAGYRMAEALSRRQNFQKKAKRPRKPTRGMQRLMQLIRDERCAAVVCTHVFAANIVSRLRVSGQLPIPCYFLATDYSCSPGVNRLEMDAWLVPHEKLVPEFTACGIPAERLIPTGIPVMQEFILRSDRSRLRRKLGLPENRRIIALSCGSMGAGRMEKLVPALVKQLPTDALLVVICSRNKRLMQKLTRRIHDERLQVLGFVDRLSDYMEAADIYLTKPGGLSTTEAIRKGAPLLLFNAVPGVETRNLQFLTGIGCACAVKTGMLADFIRQKLSDGAALQAMRSCCEREFSFDAAENICSVLLKDLP